MEMTQAATESKKYSRQKVYGFIEDDSDFSYYPEMTIDELYQESPSLVMDIGQCLSFHSKEGERRWIEMNENTTLEELFEGFDERETGLIDVFYKHRDGASIIEVNSKDNKSLLQITGYNKFVPDGVYSLSVDCDEDHADVGYDEHDNGCYLVGGQFFVLKDEDNNRYYNFPERFEQILSKFW